MNFYRGVSYDQDRPLSDDDMRRMAPSIFAAGAHESRSERFAYIPTIDVINGLRGEGFLPYSVRQGNSRIPGKREFTKHMIRLRHAEKPKKVGDSVFEICLLNSHDGTSCYNLSAAIMKLICLNGMMTGQSYMSCKVRHTGDAIPKVIEGAYEVLDMADRATDQVTQFQSTLLSDAEQQLLARSVHQIRFEGAEHSPDPSQLLRIRRHQDRGADLWTTMNVLQENAIRGGIPFQRPNENNPRRPYNMRTRPIRSVDGDTSLNRAIWTLGEEMMRLKNG